MAQVCRTGDGFGPVVTNAGDEGVQEIKAQEIEKKSAEPHIDASKNEVAVPYRATAKEASNRKAELGAGAASQKSTLTRWQRSHHDRQELVDQGDLPAAACASFNSSQSFTFFVSLRNSEPMTNVIVATAIGYVRPA